MANTTIKVNTGIQNYTFTDEDGHMFSAFRLNPTDINLAKRAMEVGEYFEKLGDFQAESIDDVAKLNKDIEEKISYVLGYDAKDVFGEVTATTVFADGTVFAFLVMDKILSEVTPALEQRQKKMEKAADKYLKKYERV